MGVQREQVTERAPGLSGLGCDHTGVMFRGDMGA